MVEARLSDPDTANGFLLDGYPRNLEQAHVLRDLLAKNGTKLDIVLDITAPHEVLVEHMLKRAQEENRADDSPEVFVERLNEYAAKTEPVSTYYADQDLLFAINGVGEISEVTERIMKVLLDAGALV
jgi:Adenylate kinase and related kinases